MAGNIGADIASLVDVNKQSQLSQTASTDTGSRASQIAGKLNSDIEETTTMLRSHFAETADTLQTSVNQHLQQVEGSNWDGASKDQARAAAGDMTREIQTVLERSKQGVDEFKTQMTNQSQSFLDSINTDFNKIMNEAATRFEQFGAAVNKFSENLQQADQTIKYQ